MEVLVVVRAAKCRRYKSMAAATERPVRFGTIEQLFVRRAGRWSSYAAARRRWSSESGHRCNRA